MAWFDGLEQKPPADDATERKLLGAVLVSDDAATPDEDLERLSIIFDNLEAADFADPFHGWLFRLIAEARRVHQELPRQLAFILARPNRAEAAKLGVQSLPYEIARLLMSPEGVSVCGKVGSIRRYANRLREIRSYREHLDVALMEVRRAYECWDATSRELEPLD